MQSGYRNDQATSTAATRRLTGRRRARFGRAVPESLRRERPGGGRGQTGETLAMLIVWPAVVVAILLMLVHAFIVTNAQSEADLAASQALRSAWRHLSLHDIHLVPGSLTVEWDDPALHAAPHPEMVAASEAAQDAAARVAGDAEGWRWWTPGVTTIHSDWCDLPSPLGSRPPAEQSGWLQVVVRGEVFGPLAAIFPGRLDEVYAVAQGPAVLAAAASDEHSGLDDVPTEILPEC